MGHYEKEAYQFLAVFRFLAYALAVLFSQVPSIGIQPLPDIQLIIILVMLGVYSALRVFSPLRWRERGSITYLILFGDFLLSLLLVLLTGGLNSIFLLYSLAPVMTAALFFEEKIAISLAATASIMLSLTHVFISQLTSRFAWIMQGYNLTLLIIYTLFCFVCATVPYRINLNIRRRIEREAIIEERRRIAREIHDGVAQALSYLNMKTKLLSDLIVAHKNVEAINEVADIRKIVQDSYEDIREAINQLSTEVRTVPLIPALSAYSADFGTNNGIKVVFDFSKPFPRLSPTAELQLMRITQELLTNVRKHSGATSVDIRLKKVEQSVTLNVNDNGNGFTSGETEHDPPGYHGLSIVRERAESLGGSVDITSTPGRGTEVIVALPLDKMRL